MRDTDVEPQRAQHRDAQKVISYFNKINPPYSALNRVDKGATGLAKPGTPPVRLTIQQALAKYLPKEYKVHIAPEVDTKTVISYDASLPWIEALGKALAGVSLEMNANMYKKFMSVKAFQTTLADVIERHVPAEYKVFTDSEINIDSLIRYDESQHWIEALSKGAIDSGIDVTANITRKLIVIKPLVTTNTDSIPQK